MTDSEPFARDRSTILIHYYRAMVGRADTWRMRMDATTNWAIVTTAAVISFALGNATIPHYGVFIASVMTLSFLLLEARRLTFYHLWQQRVLLLERGLIRPALWAGSGTAPPEPAPAPEAFASAVDPHLGRTVPTMPLRKAVARRMRRIYLYLFATQGLAWILKLASAPTAPGTPESFASRAQVAGIPGEITLGIAGATFVGALLFALALGGRDRSPTAP